MRRQHFIIVAISFLIFLGCGGQKTGIKIVQVLPIKFRIAVKSLVVDDKTSPDPKDVLIKLRWSFDPETFDSKSTKSRFRFPECGVTLYRKRPKEKSFTKIDNFKLPSSKTDLISRIAKIQDSKLKNRLINSSTGNLTKEGENFFEAIEASKKGKKDKYYADPTQLLMMASLNPDIARILGLFYVDTVNIKKKGPITYRLVGAWDWSYGCVSALQDSIFKEIEVTLDPPLDAPAWINRADSVHQVRQIKFDKPEQQVTYFWEDSKGKKQKPQPVRPEEPVVQLQWWKVTDDYIGYHIDRWTYNEDGDLTPPIRVNSIPKLLTNLELKYCTELDNGHLSSGLREVLKNKRILLSQTVTVWIGEKGKKWFMTDKKNDPTQRYFFAKEENKLNLYKLDPYLILSSTETVEETPERFFDGFALRPEKKYIYRIIGVDIFGRESTYSLSRSIRISPIDFFPIPPQRVCLESFDPISGTLRSESCPKKTGNTYTWISPGNLNQKKDTEKIGIRLKWQWTKEQQKKFNANYFHIYQDTVSCTGDGKDNDSDGKVDEEFPNGIDDDNDFLIDEDLAVTGRLVSPKVTVQQNQENYKASFSISTTDPITHKKRPVRYYYYSITTISKNIDDDNDGKRDEDPVDGLDNDGDSSIDEDDIESESLPSIPVMAYVVDKKSPAMPKAPCETNAWLKVDKNPTQVPDWEGKLALYLDYTDFAKNLIDKDIDGYNLYRSVDYPEPPKAEYVRLNRELIESTIYADHIEATAENYFYYKIEAVDNAGNVSKKSSASCPVKLPDKVHPASAIIISVSGGNEQITLGCEPSTSPDVAGYYVYRGTSQTDVATLIKNKTSRLNSSPITVVSTDTFFSYLDIDPVIEAGKNYYYIVEAVDTSGNQTFSQPAGGRAYDIKPPAPPTNLAGSVIIVTPKKVTKENGLIRVTRITPAKVGTGERFSVQVIINVKVPQVEYVSISEDPRGPLIGSETLFREWINPTQNRVLRFDYELSVPVYAPPGKYQIVGTGEAVKFGKMQPIKKLTSEIEVVSGSPSKTIVKLSWKLPEKNSCAAVWRCEEEVCTASEGYWRMIAPLRAENVEKMDDENVQIGKTYYYKVQAYDKVGNKGKFSEILKVKVE